MMPYLELSLVCNGWVEILPHGRGVALSQVHISRLTHQSPFVIGILSNDSYCGIVSLRL